MEVDKLANLISISVLFFVQYGTKTIYIRRSYIFPNLSKYTL